GSRLLVSPIAARMAAENGIDLKTIKGTGPNGRIIKRDIEALLKTAVATTAAAPRQAFSATIGPAPYRDEPVSKMRKVIATRLAESIGPIP
ncbi:E3 binding domain-containing protein, partial [Escherichia coli]|nr:E3 binding domain-containing protein [Escherichia coli]